MYRVPNGSVLLQGEGGGGRKKKKGKKTAKEPNGGVPVGLGAEKGKKRGGERKGRRFFE